MDFPILPLGFRFLPTDSECIQYLTWKFTENPLPFDSLFLDLDPYNVKQLPDIFSTVQRRDEVYMFVKLNKKGKFGNINARRTVGKGTWHGDKSTKVRDDHGTHVGMAQKLTYHEKGSSFDHKFIMTEYSLLKGTSLQYDPLRDYVLCHIYKKGLRPNGIRVYTCQSEVAVAANPISSAVAVENPSTSSYGVYNNPSYSSQVEAAAYVQPFDNPIPVLEDDFHELRMLLDNEIVEPFGLLAPQDNLDESFLKMLDAETSSFDSCWDDNLFDEIDLLL